MNKVHNVHAQQKLVTEFYGESEFALKIIFTIKLNQMKKIIRFYASALILILTCQSFGLAQTKKMAFISTTISPPSIYPLPIIYPPIVKKELNKIYEIRQNREKEVIDSLRLISVDALEKLTGYDILYGDALISLTGYENVKKHELPIDKNSELMKIASNEENVFPIQKMKVEGFFKEKRNFASIVKNICEELEVDAVAFVNWQIEIFGYGRKTYSTWLKHNFYIIGKDGTIIFYFPYVSNTQETPFEEPNELLNIYNTENISLEPLIERWTKPKHQNKLIKKGM